MGAKPGAVWIVALDDDLLESHREELLRELGGFVWAQRPLHPQVLVDRPPVRLDDRGPRHTAGLFIVAARAFDDREAGGGKRHRGVA